MKKIKIITTISAFLNMGRIDEILLRDILSKRIDIRGFVAVV
jgi:hypothetical protein